jgi:hypothetical protein
MAFRGQVLTFAWCAILLIGPAACGGSTDRSATTTSAATPAPQPTTTPSFTVNDGVYTFTGKGYSVRAPDGWQAHPDVSFDVSGARFPSDAFFAPDLIGGIQPSISISCLKPLADQTTTEEFRDGWSAFLKQLLQVDVTPSATTAGSNPAFIFAYVQNQANGEVTNADRTDIVFLSGQCRWMITLLAPAGQRDKYLPVLDGVRTSFATLG